GVCSFLLTRRRPALSTLFPYTTLFRSGGVGPYEYSIGAGFIAGQTVFTGLSTGSYSPQIRDANGCVETLSAVEFIPLNKPTDIRSEEHTSELQSRENLVCRLLLEKKNI